MPPGPIAAPGLASIEAVLRPAAVAHLYFVSPIEEFVELGGKVLGLMIKRIAPDSKVTSVVTIEDIEALATWHSPTGENV